MNSGPTDRRVNGFSLYVGIQKKNFGDWGISKTSPWHLSDAALAVGLSKNDSNGRLPAVVSACLWSNEHCAQAGEPC